MDLVLLPAVDVVNGQAVRLTQGEAGTETSYGDPREAARNWHDAGAEWIHLVDLDAAFGRGSNAELIADMVGELDLNVEVSGGIRDDESLRRAPYEVLADWHEEHDGMLRIILPDTYGTKGFLAHAPDWLAGWTGIRVDSGDPVEGAEMAIRWWQERGEDPRDKLIIFSDGLDVAKVGELFQRFRGRVKVSFGWGTLLTNDFRGLVSGDGLAPFSLVCKAVAANGRPTVKLSDNPEKATGPKAEIERYRRVFDVGQQQRLDVVV